MGHDILFHLEYLWTLIFGGIAGGVLMYMGFMFRFAVICSNFTRLHWQGNANLPQQNALHQSRALQDTVQGGCRECRMLVLSILQTFLKLLFFHIWIL